MEQPVLSETKRQRQAHIATIFDDARWERAIASILRQHQVYLVQGRFACGDYSPEFVEYIKTRVPDLKCAR